MKNLSRTLILAITYVLSGTAPLFASQLHLVPIEADVPNIKYVLKVKVTKVERKQDYMKMKDGTNGPMTSSHILLSGDVMKVVWGSAALEKIKTRYTWQSGNVYDAKGNVILTKSFLRSGSGLENDIKEGEEYLFSFNYIPVTADKNSSPLLELMRSDPVSQETEILKLLNIAEEKKKSSNKGLNGTR